MPVSAVYSAAVLGVNAYPVLVEVDVSWGLPCFQIVGLPDGAVKEARERVRSAIRNSGYDFPDERITINLAPADLKKAGSGYDLAIALGIMAANGQIDGSLLANYFLCAELSLDGDLRPVRGILPVAALAAQKDQALRGIIVAPENAGEALIVRGIHAVTARSLGELVKQLRSSKTLRTAEPPNRPPAGPCVKLPDMADVKGQAQAKRALEIAAAGAHNLLMIGPPGSGKTMLARRLPSILPDLSFEEALDTTRIHSVAGLLQRGALVSHRPFRSPHHSISDAGLVGGGSIPRPGEISLAHNGVLFLDELPEFRKPVLEVLRQPLEDGMVTLARAQISLTFPSRTMLVASMNPCPCGHLGDPKHPCRCSQIAIERYQGRISGPLLDRIDLHIEVPAVPWEDLQNRERGRSSKSTKEAVSAARALQFSRFKKDDNVYTNAAMSSGQLQQHCRIGADGEKLLADVVTRLGLSARAWGRILKVGRTIADLEGSDSIQVSHLAEAVQYRTLDRRTQ